MSLSPPLRRLSSAGSSSKESLINAYEAEEERIINILSRKLEQVRCSFHVEWRRIGGCCNLLTHLF